MAEVVQALGMAEGLPAHIRSVQARLERLHDEGTPAPTRPADDADQSDDGDATPSPVQP